LLQGVDLTFAYGERSAPAVSGVSIAAGRGDVVGLIGPNGSGKTTLLRLMAGMLRPNAGQVLLDGQPLDRLKRREIARRLAVVPQETHSTFDFSVLEIVLMGRYPHLGAFEVEGPRDLAMAREALAATGTDGLEGRPFATLSGGEKQRVVIAGALAQASELLLLDEPTTSLDLGYQLEIMTLLRALNRDRGVTMIVSTHDLNLAAALCSRVVLIRNGRVLTEGSTAEALTRSNIAELYGVDVDVSFHAAAGHLTVVPIARQVAR
jgi:iron complex transport system ATP-binding protein